MRVIPLRRVFSVVNGGTPTADEENWGGDVAWATPVDLAARHGSTIGATERTLTVRGLRTGSALVPAASLIVSTRAPIGYVAETEVPMAFNQGCRGLVPRQPVDVRFFRYQLSALTLEMQSRGQGSTFAELSTDALGSVPIAVPSLSEQRVIADYLDAETLRIDGLIEKRRRMISLIGERQRVVIASLLVRAPRLPLRRFLLGVEQGWSPSVADVQRASPSQWAVLKLSAVTGGDYRPDQHKALNEEPAQFRKYEVMANDLLMTRANTPELVGDVVYVHETPPRLLLPDLIYRLTFDPTRASGAYLGYALRTREVRAQLAAAARGSSQSMVKLRGEDIGALLVPLPAMPEQNRLAEAAHTIAASTSAYHEAMSRQIDFLLERRQALITAAVSGQVEIPRVAA